MKRWFSFHSRQGLVVLLLFGWVFWLWLFWVFFGGEGRNLGGYFGLIQVHSYNFINFEKEMEDGIQYL